MTDPAPKLTPAGLAEWERVRAEIKARNAELLALSVARERAAMAAARADQMARASALVAELSTWRSVETGRAQARQWAAEHPNATDRLPELQAQANARAGADRGAQPTDDPPMLPGDAGHLHPLGT